MAVVLLLALLHVISLNSLAALIHFAVGHLGCFFFGAIMNSTVHIASCILTMIDLAFLMTQ